MENNKKELYLADFYNLSVACDIIYICSMKCSVVKIDGSDEMKTDLDDMVELLSSAVTLKDGTIPKDWNMPIADCNYSFSY